MAYVATVRHDGTEIQIGVSRYDAKSRSDDAEMAVAVADEWQRRGLGTMLVKELVQTARSNGVKRLYSIALVGNVAMRALAKNLGMNARQDSSNLNQIMYSLALS